MYAIIADDPGYCATICKHECKLKDVNNDKRLKKVKQNIGKVVESDENFECGCLKKKNV
jgi:hypothetical protein